MKTTLIASLALGTALTAAASARYDAIINTWRAGRQTNILAQANARLATNRNDLVALLMKASYDFDFSDPATLSNTLARVLTVGSTVTTPAFSNAFVLTQLDIRGTFTTLATETNGQFTAEMPKVTGTGLPMAYENELKALDKDGLLR